MEAQEILLNLTSEQKVGFPQPLTEIWNICLLMLREPTILWSFGWLNREEYRSGMSLPSLPVTLESGTSDLNQACLTYYLRDLVQINYQCLHLQKGANAAKFVEFLKSLMS